MKHELPKLPYAYDALEPFIDVRTMELHHGKHHAIYVAKLNEALDKHPKLFELSLEDLLLDLDNIPEDIRTAIRNHGGGHYNHSIFWRTMSPPTPNQSKSGNEPHGKLAEEINRNFGDFVRFKEGFTKAALGLFGSGWAWLVLQEALGEISIITTPNQDCPITIGLTPILGLDLWEHAYYLKYQNRRAEYIENWWNVVDWDGISNHSTHGGK